MGTITVTLTKINNTTVSNLKRGIDTGKIDGLRPTTEGNLATAAIFEAHTGGTVQTWYVSETYTQVLDAINAIEQEAGAELLANKATDFSVLNDTLYPTTDAVEDSFQPIWYAAATGTDTYAITLTGVVPTAYYTGMTIHATFANANSGGASTINVNALGAKAITKNISTALAANDIAVGKVYELKYDGTRFQIDAVDKEAIANKVTSMSGASTDVQYPSAKLVYDTTQLLAPKASPTFTGPVIIETEAVASNNTRAASTAFVQGEFTAKIAKIASGALVAGVRTINDAAIQATSIVVVQKIALGGTEAQGGYKVTINAGVSVVITALQADGTTTETSSTDTVMGLIYY